MSNRQALMSRLGAAEGIIRETPIIHLESPANLHIDLYAKLEFLNGVGSIKDRPALWILKRAIERGQVGPETTVIESSSGNFACALSVFCSVLGLKFIPVIDPNISPVYETTLQCNCDTVVKVSARDDTGGYLKTRLEKVRELLATHGDVYWPNQYENPDAMAAHYHLTGAEIEKLPLDYVFVGVSTGGTIAGVSQRLKESNPSLQVVAVDAEGSVIFGGRPKKRSLPGLGSSISPSLVRQARIDDIVIVPEDDAVFACQTLLTRHGLFVGASTGSAYSAIESYFLPRAGRARPRVLFLCCDRGGAYLHNVFNLGSVGRRSDLERQEAAAANG
jgi:N-(2-amino-2-carboxyethyl)-L-glutamate synthase